MRYAAWRSVLLTAWLMLAPWSGAILAPARAEVVAAAAGGPLTVNGIPLPQNAEPFLAADLTVENLRALVPDAGELGTSGRVRAVIYHVQTIARPDEVAAYYRDALGAQAIPRRRPAPAGVRPADDGVRLLQLERPERTLAVRCVAASGPTRITVAMCQGSAAPATVLRAIEMLRTGRSGRRPELAPSLLHPDKSALDFEAKYESTRLALLKQKLNASEAPEPIIDVMRSLLSQATALHHVIYRAPQRVPAPEVLEACAQEAQRQGWKLLSVEAVTPDTVVVLYVQPESRGMVMMRAGQAAKNVSALGAVAPLLATTTEFNRLEVTGPIDLQALFRPSQARPAPQKLPFILPAPRRTLPTPPPAGPFSSQRRN
jgi:hypothetical protein